MPKINQEELSSIIIICPPESEQQKIIAHLDKQCASIDTLIEDLNEEITQFAEYRTRLISDVVTGKLDVRGVVVPEFEVVEDVEEDVCTIDYATSDHEYEEDD